MLYAEAHRSETDHYKLREEYAGLTLDEKYEFVKKAVDLAPEVIESAIISKKWQSFSFLSLPNDEKSRKMLRKF